MKLQANSRQERNHRGEGKAPGGSARITRSGTVQCRLASLSGLPRTERDPGTLGFQGGLKLGQPQASRDKLATLADGPTQLELGGRRSPRLKLGRSSPQLDLHLLSLRGTS